MESGLGREREAAQQWRGPSSRDLTVDTGMGALSLSLSFPLSLSPKRRHFLSILNFSVLEQPFSI